MAYGQPVRSVISVWCSALLPHGYTRSSCSPFLPPFPPLFAPCSSFSFPINGNGGVRSHEKKRDWLDGNPSAGFDAILGPICGYLLPKIYAAVTDTLEDILCYFFFYIFLLDIDTDRYFFMSLMKIVCINERDLN